MARDLISKRTRNEFREFLVGWTLREIEGEFEAAGIEYDRAYTPDVSGQRRSFVEQHYRSLDFAKPADVRRLLVAYAGILERAERDLATVFDRDAVERSIDSLKACLSKDGLKYERGAITPIAPDARRIFADERSVTEITRRAVFDELRVGSTSWSGRLSETDFLSRLYDLTALPSHDGRFNSMSGDVWQHRENNLDWPDDWVFTDDRLDLLGAPDEVVLRFLCELAHPVVRPDPNEARKLVSTFNAHLASDGWELIEGKPISGKPTFVATRRWRGTVTLPDPIHAADVLSDEYVSELSEKCDSRLASRDLEGAVTVARTLLEAILSELEQRLVGAKGDYKGDLSKQFKRVIKLLRMDHERQDLDDRFKDVIRGLVMVVSALAPLRNKISDGHARARKPALHHARVVVNAAKTVSAFLVESYRYQRAKALVRDASQGEKEASG